MIEKLIPIPSEEEMAEAWKGRMAHHRADLNCITHWLPKIVGHVPTPRTEIVTLDLTRETDKELWDVLDGAPAPAWWWDWALKLKDAARTISQSGPWFLRTGVFSGKHRWRECCAVTDVDKIGQHALELFGFSQEVDFLGLPYHVWAVREWLHGPHILEWEPFAGMPLRREFRAFAKDGEVLCIHPYWPADALSADVHAMPEFQAMNTLGDDEAAVRDLVSRASRCIEGEWSIDCLWTDRGWYVTDMAEARKSYHWPDCERRVT